MQHNFSISEEHGIAAMPKDAKNIYSVGVSTAGAAEIRMAKAHPERRIIATTIDKKGAAATQALVNQQGFSNQITIALEDAAQPLPYPENTFDYIYARLVLHYLTRQQLTQALAELHRTLKEGGRLFIVIRSADNLDAKEYATDYDETTGLTTFTAKPNKDVHEIRKRFFHTEASISQFLTDAGFIIGHITSYGEKLFHDYERTVTVDYIDNLIEVIAVK